MKSYDEIFEQILKTGCSRSYAESSARKIHEESLLSEKACQEKNPVDDGKAKKQGVIEWLLKSSWRH